MKRHITTIVLVIVAVVLGVYLWRDRENVTEGEKKNRQGSVFPAWRKEDVARVEIARDDETIVLERDAKAESSWRMKSPRSERADQGAVERLLTALEFAQIARKAASDGQLGLDAPRATGSVTMGKLVFKFALGGTSPRPEGSAYFSLDDGDPIVVKQELVTQLLQPSDTYRDRTVVPYLSLEMKRFEVKHDKGGFAVERLDDKSFKVVGPNALAAREALDRVWGALAEMRAEAFPKDADADRLTATPKVTILIVPQESKPEGEIVIGDVCPGHPDDLVVLRRKPTRVAACVPKGALDPLLVTPDTLVERRPTSLHADEIEEVRWESIGAEPHAIELARKGSGFHQREPADRDLTAEEADAASELLVAIERSVAEEIRTPTSPFAPIARFRVRAGPREETLEIGPLGEEKVRAKRLRDGAEMILSRVVARRLIPRATTTKPRVILGDTRRVTKVILRCGVPQEAVDTGSGLKLREPKGYETDGSLSQLVDALARGKSDLWVADEPDPSMGLDGEGCRVILGFADENSPATIRFGNRAEGAIYGKVEGSPHVFLAPLSLHDLAKRIYVSRAALRVPADAISDVRVTPAPKDPLPLLERRKEAAANLYPDDVASIGSNDIPKVDLTIEIVQTNDRPTLKVRCGPVDKNIRQCATDGVRAIFDVHSSRIDPILKEAPARDR